MITTLTSQYLGDKDSKFASMFLDTGDPVDHPYYQFLVDPDRSERGDLDEEDNNRTQMTMMLDGLRRQR